MTVATLTVTQPIHVKRVIGAALLIAGTTIGGGILAFPVAAGVTGFVPSMSLFVLFWLVMCYSAFVMMEATLRMDGDTNLVSMARYALGPAGTVIAWTSYLFLLYSLMTAYTAAGAGMVDDFFRTVVQVQLPAWVAPMPLTLLFGAVVAAGMRNVDTLNRVLMMGLIATFLTTIFALAPDVRLERLTHYDFAYLPMATSVIATAFGFHIVIPSLASYLENDTRELRMSILIGTSLPFIAYCVWQLVALGVVPLEGQDGLRSAYAEGLPVTRPMRAIYESISIATGLRLFEFCAICTSFLGVSLSLMHFFTDGLKAQGWQHSKAVTCALTFVPPVVITLTNPRAFLLGIEYAGTFGVLVLLVILPALMAWIGREKETRLNYRAPGGKLALTGMMLFAFAFIGMECCRKLGILG